MQCYNAELVGELKLHDFNNLATAYENCKDMDVGFKRCGNTIVALQLPPIEDTTLNRRGIVDKRYAKFRAKYCPRVVFICDLYEDAMVPKKTHYYHPSWTKPVEIVYQVGQRVEPDMYDRDMDNICSHGIHFYLSLEAALSHDPETGNTNYWMWDGQAFVSTKTSPFFIAALLKKIWDRYHNHTRIFESKSSN